MVSSFSFLRSGSKEEVCELQRPGDLTASERRPETRATSEAPGSPALLSEEPESRKRRRRRRSGREEGFFSLLLFSSMVSCAPSPTSRLTDAEEKPRGTFSSGPSLTQRDARELGGRRRPRKKDAASTLSLPLMSNGGGQTAFYEAPPPLVLQCTSHLQVFGTFPVLRVCVCGSSALKCPSGCPFY